MRTGNLYSVLAGVAALAFIGVGLWPAVQGGEADMKLAGVGIAILAPGVTRKGGAK